MGITVTVYVVNLIHDSDVLEILTPIYSIIIDIIDEYLPPGKFIETHLLFNFSLCCP